MRGKPFKKGDDSRRWTKGAPPRPPPREKIRTRFQATKRGVLTAPVVVPEAREETNAIAASETASPAVETTAIPVETVTPALGNVNAPPILFEIDGDAQWDSSVLREGASPLTTAMMRGEESLTRDCMSPMMSPVESGLPRETLQQKVDSKEIPMEEDEAVDQIVGDEALAPVVEEVAAPVAPEAGAFFLSPTMDMEKQAEDFAAMLQNGEVLLPDTEGNINIEQHSGIVLVVNHSDNLPLNSKNTAVEDITGLVSKDINGVVSKFKCEACGSTFKRKYNLERHQKKFHEQANVLKGTVQEDMPVKKSQQCSICAKSFSSSSSRNRHVREIHSNSTQEETLAFAIERLPQSQLQTRSQQGGSMERTGHSSPKRGLPDNSETNLGNLNEIRSPGSIGRIPASPTGDIGNNVISGATSEELDELDCDAVATTPKGIAAAQINEENPAQETEFRVPTNPSSLRTVYTPPFKRKVVEVSFYGGPDQLS